MELDPEFEKQQDSIAHELAAAFPPTPGLYFVWDRTEHYQKAREGKTVFHMSEIPWQRARWDGEDWNLGDGTVTSKSLVYRTLPEMQQIMIANNRTLEERTKLLNRQTKVINTPEELLQQYREFCGKEPPKGIPPVIIWVALSIGFLALATVIYVYRAGQ